MNPIAALASQFGLKMSVSSDNQFYLSNGKLMSYSTVDGIYTSFLDWMESTLQIIDRRSILTMFNSYVNAKKLSVSDQQLLRAGIRTNVEQEYAASMGNLSAAYYGQVDKRIDCTARGGRAGWTGGWGCLLT